MNKAYLDNASTTAIHPEVIAEMVRVMSDNYGNPSSTHATGRNAKVVLETARKTIASLINAEAREIIFTSCGTEANNWIIRSAVKDLKVQRIISSRAEHHSVLNTVIMMKAEYGIEVQYVNLLPDGSADLTHLVKLLSENVPTLVSLMHVNNETGGVLDIERAGRICKQAGALFHTDAVQSVGKVKFDLQNSNVDFLTASAHKFHGPKGVGFAFVRKNTPLQPMIFGGEQEKGFRAGTEAVHQVAGMARALQLSYETLEADREHITSLKNYLLGQLEINFPGYKVNGKSGNTELFYNITNILLPLGEEKTAMILFHLDMKGVAVSRGSACQSGSIRPSHVLREILPEDEIGKPSLRISLSHFNTKEDIDLLIDALKAV
ncbi:cysteine desulfurase [Flavobacterium sp. MFBS3-15]|uniref:cysteine desulfurase family protein n=1 Tax=Flavobacterium sp. MFBS3-15 TaxID=2989816 RepID=UPI002235B351|nr:cysteine desulfurase family protein [Flavobacterium sp. MFBS3-15]MCW4469616.1 cysteine desulfurase [Flavobacterium sp. MFBS3-15]